MASESPHIVEHKGLAAAAEGQLQCEHVLPRKQRRCKNMRSAFSDRFCTRHLGMGKAYGQPDDCPVCMEALATEAALSCGHFVHRECIVRSGKNTCPICRKKVYLCPRDRRACHEQDRQFREAERVAAADRVMSIPFSLSFILGNTERFRQAATRPMQRVAPMPVSRDIVGPGTTGTGFGSRSGSPHRATGALRAIMDEIGIEHILGIEIVTLPESLQMQLLRNHVQATHYALGGGGGGGTGRR